MKLLILTQYFPPEVGAPQNRLFELALRLQANGVEVTVLTAMPNYPQMRVYDGYREKRYLFEEMQGLKVHRASIYVSKSKSVIARLRNYFSFVISSVRTGRKELEPAYDFLLCESPPLFLGYSALYLSRLKKAKLIFNVSDLWPESAEKLGVVTNKALLAMAYRLEARLYKRSTLVTGQTKGICEDIRSRFPGVRTYWLPNGADLEYYDPSRYEGGDWRNRAGLKPDDLVFLYAGIIGIAQGLEIILHAAAEVNDTHCRFVLMGSGPEKSRLMEEAEKLKLSNVLFLDPVPKSQMPMVLKSVNVAIVPLRKLELFKGAIPSKIFESLAMRLPVLLGVDGEARELFIEKGKCGVYFEPGNAAALVQGINYLRDPDVRKQLGDNGRKFTAEYFDRNRIASEFYQELKQL